MNSSPKNFQRTQAPMNKSKKGKSPSLHELAGEVKMNFFADENLYNDLFALESSKQLDKVFNQLEIMVKEYAGSVTSSQLRNVYAKIVKTKNPNDLKLLRPNLAYIAARQDNLKAKKFMAFIDLLIQQVDSPDKLQSFKKTMEAIVAYHKFYAKN